MYFAVFYMFYSANMNYYPSSYMKDPFPETGYLKEDESCHLGHMVVTKDSFFYRIYEPNAWLTDEVLRQLTNSLLNTVSFF